MSIPLSQLLSNVPEMYRDVVREAYELGKSCKGLRYIVEHDVVGEYSITDSIKGLSIDFIYYLTDNDEMNQGVVLTQEKAELLAQTYVDILNGE